MDIRDHRLQLSDLGEAHFLPTLMAALRREAPSVRVESSPLPHTEIRDALDSGVIDFAMGFLPSVRNTQQVQLMQDHYAVLLRAGHPLLERRSRGAPTVRDLAQLDYVDATVSCASHRRGRRARRSGAASAA